MLDQVTVFNWRLTEQFSSRLSLSHLAPVEQLPYQAPTPTPAPPPMIQRGLTIDSTLVTIDSGLFTIDLVSISVPSAGGSSAIAITLDSTVVSIDTTTTTL